MADVRSGSTDARMSMGGAVAYRPDLDGLRAVAVILVILTHARWPWPNNGGDAGVTAFFVLSGFLITGILRNQQARQGRIGIAAFYRRRIIRLAPALIGLLAFTLVGGVAVGWAGNWQLGIVSCLVYVSNWVQVAGLSINPLGHTWSLAIEEQFYLLWPAVLILARGRLLPLALGAIVVGSVVRLISSGTFEYFSTITRADAILVGCVVAIVSPRWSGGLAALGLIGLIGVGLFVPAENHEIAIPASMIATTLIIGGRLAPLGHLAPIGLRAYSLYLWNWPMTILFGSVGAVAPLMTVVVGELSYRLLEAPVLARGRARKMVAPAPQVVRVAAQRG